VEVQAGQCFLILVEFLPAGGEVTLAPGVGTEGVAAGPARTAVLERVGAALLVGADRTAGGCWSTDCTGTFWPPCAVLSAMTSLPHHHHHCLLKRNNMLLYNQSFS
jgi:hypothetical protein